LVAVTGSQPVTERRTVTGPAGPSSTSSRRGRVGRSIWRASVRPATVAREPVVRWVPGIGERVYKTRAAGGGPRVSRFPYARRGGQEVPKGSVVVDGAVVVQAVAAGVGV